jgi:iron complex outermembrane receptor protein/vitamin B12 transporter
MLLSLNRLRWICTFIFAFTAIALAAPTANIRGTVSDPSGAVISHAKVELIVKGLTVATAATDAKGQYSFSLVQDSTSRLRVSASGFRVVEKALNSVGNAHEAVLDFVLPVASLSEQITVTSTGSPTPQSQLGAAVTVLSSTNLQGTRDLFEGLVAVPGVQATETGGAGGPTSIFIRGGDSDANKILIDGIPMNNIGGVVQFANIASAAIEQVEVLRGPNSALYGSDALAGVISLTTAKGSTPLPYVTYRLGGGNFSTYQQEGSVGGHYKRLDYFSDFARFDSSNNIPDDEYHNGTFTGNFGWQLSRTSTLRATVHHDQLASGSPNAIQLYGIPADVRQSNEDAYFGATWEDKTTTKWNNLLRYGGIRLRSQDTQFQPAGIPYYQMTYGFPYLVYIGKPVTLRANGCGIKGGCVVSGQALESYSGTYPSSSPDSTDKDFVYAQSDYAFNPHLRGLLAFRYEDERGYSGYPPANSIERGNYSYTFELQGDVKNRLFYTIGSGLENNGLFGWAGTPRASLAWQVARGGAGGLLSGTKLRASFGKGIKEPQLYDQLSSLYDFLKDNGYSSYIAQYHVAPIGPQNSRTYDGGVDQYLFDGRSRVSLTLFHNEFTNGIEYIPWQGLSQLGLPSAVVKAVEASYEGADMNSEAYRAMGAELETEYQWKHSLFLRAGYTYLDATVQHSLAENFGYDGFGADYNTSSTSNFPTVPIGAWSPLVGARPFRRAPHTGYFEVSYQHRHFFTALRGTFVGSRDDSDFLSDKDSGTNMLLPNHNLDAAYQRLDLTSSYQANHHLAFEANIQNLLSQHYSEAFGYPSLPFTFRTGMKFSFGGDSWSWK